MPSPATILRVDVKADNSNEDPAADLLALPDAQERLYWITERGRRLPEFSIAERSPQNRIPGCVSSVWMIDESSADACHFRGYAEASILRGLVALLCRRSEGRAPSLVAEDVTDLVSALQLERHLTPTRVNGVRALQKWIRDRARVHAHPPGP